MSNEHHWETGEMASMLSAMNRGARYSGSDIIRTVAEEYVSAVGDVSGWEEDGFIGPEDREFIGELLDRSGLIRDTATIDRICESIISRVRDDYVDALLAARDLVASGEAHWKGLSREDAIKTIGRHDKLPADHWLRRAVERDQT